jgi:hypothetical protein
LKQIPAQEHLLLSRSLTDKQYVEDTPDSWPKLLTDRSIVKRGLKFAVIVGCILIVINHGDAILRGDVEVTRIAQMALTVLVPYGVSVFSSISTIRRMGKQPC